MNHNNHFRENPLLNRPIAEIPEVDPEFYMDELLRWLSKEYLEISKSNKIAIDYTTRHEDWPKLMDSKPKHIKWDQLNREDISSNMREIKSFGNKNISTSHLIFIIQTLTTIEKNIESFITRYASFQQLTRLLESYTSNVYDGEIILINKLKDQIISQINDQSRQLIPKLYHIRDHGFLMSTNLKNVNSRDKRTEEYVYEYGFSKISSDNFSHSLVEILNQRLITIQNLERQSSDHKATTAYQWKNMQNFYLVTELGNSLKKEMFIDKETRMVDFKSIFEGTVKNHVNWIGDSALSEILYLMYLLWDDERFRWVRKPKQPYRNLCNCFHNNGKIFSSKYLVTDGNAKTIYSRIRKGTEIPIRAKIIDNIFVMISNK